MDRATFMDYVALARWQAPYRGCLCDEDGTAWTRSQRADLVGESYSTIKRTEDALEAAGLIIFQECDVDHKDSKGRLRIVNYDQYQSGSNGEQTAVDTEEPRRGITGPVQGDLSTMNCSERELEDWLWDRPEALGLDFGDSRLRWVGRQVRLPSDGILDLLGIIEGNDMPQLVVAELKVRKADGRDLTQLLSYMSVLPRAMAMRCEDYLSEQVDDWDQICELCGEQVVEAWGLLIAPAITERVALACTTCNVTPLVAQSSFSFHGMNPTWQHEKIMADWSPAMQDAMQNALEGMLPDGSLPDACGLTARSVGRPCTWGGCTAI